MSIPFLLNGADVIEIAKLKNKMWQCVVKKGEYQANDWALYFEIDSLIPIEQEIRAETPFEFLRPRAKEYDGKLQYRLKTMKLRGALSQGLLMPISMIGLDAESVSDQRDYAEIVGVTKYDPPESTFNGNRLTSGPAGGAFPSFIHKTDQERIQNIVAQYRIAANSDEPFEITYKLDGSSTTVYVNDNHFGVCSRNLELRIPDDWNDANSHFIQAAIKAGWLFKLILIKCTTGRNLAFQGELCGPGIQGNFEGLEEHGLYLYDIFDIDAQRYLLPMDRVELAIQYDIKHVPIYNSSGVLPIDINACLDLADGESGLNGKYRERISL